MQIFVKKSKQPGDTSSIIRLLHTLDFFRQIYKIFGKQKTQKPKPTDPLPFFFPSKNSHNFQLKLKQINKN
jgi:hypothetical protein